MDEPAKRISLRRRLIHLLDQPGGRRLLGKIATFVARRISKRDIEIFYDDIWIHRLLTEYYADSSDFNYYKWHFRNWPGRHRQWRDEARVRWFSRYKPRLDDVILDIGAGVGTDTIIFSGAVARNGHVYAIEADRRTYNLLVKTRNWNRQKNITCLWAEIADKPGAERPGSGEKSNEISPGAEDLELDGDQSPVLTIDDIFERFDLDEVGLLKMSIGGAERRAIKGMQRSIGKIRHVAIACHDSPTQDGDAAIYSTRDEVMRFLEDKGFDVSARTENSERYVLNHVYGARK